MDRVKENCRRFFAGVSCVLLLTAVCTLSAQENRMTAVPFSSDAKESSAELRQKEPVARVKKLTSGNVDMSADSYEYVGSNLIAKGHVVIRAKGLQITADSAVINLLTKDLEASGHVVLSSLTSKSMQLSPGDYERYLEDPMVQVSVSGISTSPDGRQSIQAQVTFNNAYMEAERISGSMASGAFQFRNFALKTNQMYFRGRFAERTAEGQLRLYNSNLSTCEYLLDDNSHYSISSKKILLTPREDKRSAEDLMSGDHTVLAQNNFFRLWDVPVLWFPILYKPRELSLFGIRFDFGRKSDWGPYIRTRKEFEILDEAALVRTGFNVDYYDERGMGFGWNADVFTDNSKTEFFAYYVHDRNPYNYWDDSRSEPPDDQPDISREEWRRRYFRYKIPKDRYEFRLSNLTHLTPRLDFRGQVDVISDYQFLQDFFEARYNRDVQPPSFAAAEYQGDRYSVTFRTDFKVNRFDTALNRLPELRLDLPRQELWKNIYYQGETSAGYYQMSWRKYDYNRDEYPLLNINTLLAREGRRDLIPELRQFGSDKEAAAKYLASRYPGEFKGYFENPERYSAFRFDTLHGLYYPMQFFGALNLIPRALARFTAYSKSSKTGLNMDDLARLFTADKVDQWPPYTTKIKNYDNDGSAKYRFAFELGMEGNVKFHKTWQKPRNAFLRLDGLRHVFMPYFNLVYIPKPTVNYKHLYYFDDVDLIDKEAFIRLGMYNRLQTRRNGKIHEWLSMENYWDFHFEKRDGFNHVGDFGTRLTFSPSENLSFTTELLLDAGGNSKHDAVIRHGSDPNGQRGISSNFINSFNVSMNYSPARDWKFSLGYYYMDEYTQRSIMSMGSTLTQLNATSRYKYTFEREQTITGSLAFPTFDKRLKGIFSVSYNIDENVLDDAGISFRRDFHCWYAQLGVGCGSERNARSKLDWDYNFNFTIGLSAMPFAAYSSSVKAE